MKKKSLFKNKVQMVCYIILFIILIAMFIAIGQINFKVKEISDAERFSELYNLVDNDNLYEFTTSSGVVEILNGRSGIILMAFPDNIWSNYYAKFLNDVGKELELDKIYYYDFESDRRLNNGSYETIVNKLKVYVPVNDENKTDIQAPTVVFIKNGEVIGYFDDTSIMKGPVTPELYYTENQINLTKDNFASAIKEYLK